MTHAFALVRHGYRSPNPTTPPGTFDLGTRVTPRVVCSPSYGASFAENLLNRTISHTLPCIVQRSKHLAFPEADENHAGKLKTRTYADSAVSRCWQTAVGWASYLQTKCTCGVPTEPQEPVDARVNQTAAEKDLDVARWTADQKIAAARFRDRAQKQWSRLLFLLGFDQTSLLSTAPTEDLEDLNGLDRALVLLGLPLSAFRFGTAVIMAFGVVDHTIFQILANSKWPKPRTRNGRLIHRAAARVLGTILAVRYPPGYVSDTLSTAVSRLAVHYLQDDHPLDPLLAVACTHEEHIHFLRTALDLGQLSYPEPTSCLLFVQRRDDDQPILQVFEVHNAICVKGKVQPTAVSKLLGTVRIQRLKQLAQQTIRPLPAFNCTSTFAHGRPC